MRGVLIRETGGPEVLRLEDVPEPEAGPGQVLVTIEAIGVAYYEKLFRTGMFPLPSGFPAVFGHEAVGTVTAVGDGVDTALTGTRVAVMSMSGGTYAESLAVSAAEVVPIPDGVSSVDAVAAAVPGAVALCLWREADPPHERVIVEAAGSGGVGGYLVQLARESGQVIATAGTEVKRALATELGADLVLDHYDPQWTDKVPGDVDVLFEAIGGDNPAKLLGSLTPGTGRILLYGRLSGEPQVALMELVSRGLSLTGCGGPVWGKQVQAARADVLDLLALGELRALVADTMPLADAAKAHDLLDRNAVTGKLVLVP
jgi:NADPH2:quinone reductase